MIRPPTGRVSFRLNTLSRSGTPRAAVAAPQRASPRRKRTALPLSWIRVMVTFPATSDQLRQDCASIRAFAERPAQTAMLRGATRQQNRWRTPLGPAASMAPATNDRTVCPRCLRAQARPLEASPLADDRLVGCQSCGEVWMQRQSQNNRHASDIDRAPAAPAATCRNQRPHAEAEVDTAAGRPASILEFRRRQSAA